MIAGTLLGFLRPETSAKGSERTVTFEERVAYQRAIEGVYWRHRVWPKERSDPKPSLDAVMSQVQLEKKVAEYLRNSQALADYWQHPITAEQLQAEMDRMVQHSKQPEVLRELFEALGNDPFVIAECLARPALAERLIRNWYAYDQRIHGELKQRAEAELQAHPSIEQMKELSAAYNEIELVRSDSAQDKPNRGGKHGLKLNSQEWDKTVQKLAAMLGNSHPVAAGVSPAQPTRLPLQKPDLAGAVSPANGTAIMQIKTHVLSSLQEDESRYYAAALIEKTNGRLKLATVAWSKDPFESWISRTENRAPTAIAAAGRNHKLPEIPEGGECIDNTWTATAGPPDIRYGHTVVWTGSEMIIWGGGYGHYPYLSFRNTGARYNPIIDTWTAISTTNAPVGRVAHTAVWTGSEMIIWGGADDLFSVTNTGGRYNPNTDSWTATSTANAPSGRLAHAAVWTGNEMIVWSGNGAGYQNTGGKYNPSTNTWAATSTINAPSARYGTTAVWTGSEMIVWGGEDNNSFPNTGGRYNPSTNTWTTTNAANAPDARYSHTAVWAGNEMIVWGGFDGNNNLNAGGRYNPGANSWTATSTTNAPTSRSGHTAVWTGSEMIVWGGNGDFSYFNDGGRYNPTANSWTNINTYNVPVARASHTAVWTGSEMIVWGGGGYPNYFNNGGRYDPAIDSWTATSVANAPSSRVAHTAVWTGNEMIVWGGQDENFIELDTGGRYNPGTNNWIATGTTDAPSPRHLHTAIWTGSEMIVSGGWDGFDDLNTGGLYDPNTNTWTATTTTGAPMAREAHTAVWTGNEMIVWGGWNFDSQENLNTGGRYDPGTNSWTATETSSGPEGRSNHTAVWTGSEMIVWGGGPSFNTGGRYDPAADTWSAISTINAPDGRFLHTAVWTGDEMIVWGGGYIDPNNFIFVPFNTGGRYHPGIDNWTATSLNGAPDPRYSHTAVWTGNEMLVWGGSGLDVLNTGGRYCAQAGPPPTPTPTPRVTPRPRPTPHRRPTPP